MGVRRLIDLPDWFAKKDTFSFDFDGLEFVSGDLFTDTSADTGASWAASDAHGGKITGATGATDNNEAYLHTTKEIFLFQAEKPISVRFRLTTPEANTDDANYFIGLMDAVGANSIVDDGAGPKASYSGAGFFKVDGGTNFKVEASVGSTRYLPLSGNGELTAGNSLTGVAVSPSSSQAEFGIDFLPFSSTEAEVHFYYNGDLVQKLTMTFTSATEMMVVVGVKAGGANSEAPVVDRIWGAGVR